MTYMPAPIKLGDIPRLVAIHYRRQRVLTLSEAEEIELGKRLKSLSMPKWPDTAKVWDAFDVRAGKLMDTLYPQVDKNS